MSFKRYIDEQLDEAFTMSADDKIKWIIKTMNANGFKVTEKNLFEKLGGLIADAKK